jgi:hypothetical protein
MTDTDDCRCKECEGIHSEFIAQFGRWPSMTHTEALALRDRRISNEASWDRLMR